MCRALLVLLSVKALRACPPSHPCAACNQCWTDFFQKISGGCTTPCSVTPSPPTCTYTELKAFKGPCTDQAPCFVKPSEFEACLRQVQVSSDRMIEFVDNLDKTFEQLYAFYYTAADPLASDPKNHEASMGNTIYNGSQHGQSNLRESLAAIRASVASHGADLTTFWEVARPFHDLYDAHVSAMPQLALGGLGPLSMYGGIYEVYVLPERIFSQTSDLLLYPKFSYEGSELKLSIDFYNVSHSLVETKSVARLNGQTPYAFVVSLANAPQEGIFFKALGVRMNSLLAQSYRGTGFPQSPLPFLFHGASQSRPSDILPERFTVEYADGSSEQYIVRVALPSRNHVVTNVTLLEELVNQPGEKYQHLQIAIGRAKQPVSKRLEPTSPLGGFKVQPMHSRHVASSTDLNFTMLYAEEGMSVGYALMDNYTVLKIENFVGPSSVGIMTGIWDTIVAASQTAGLDRLIVDISSNGGGVIDLGMMLAQCMYPEVSLENFLNPYDQVYNEPMSIWAERALPFFEKLLKAPRAEIVSIAKSLTQTQIQSIVNVCEAVVGLDGNSSVTVALHHAAQRFAANSTVANFEEVVEIYHYIVRSHNPWTVAAGYSTFSSKVCDGRPVCNYSEVKRKEFIRGGVKANFTETFYMYDRTKYDAVHAIVNRSYFKEYVLLSNGASGSTANTFQTTVGGIAANGVRGATASLSQVSYGGTRDPRDTPLTQFAGGSVSHPVVSGQYVALGALYMGTIIFNSTKYEAQMTELFLAMEAALPEVPYYLNDWSGMPVTEIYNKFMTPGAMPLEYVDMPPQYHIGQIYTQTKFRNYAGQLPELYGNASQFFGKVLAFPTASPALDDDIVLI